MGSLSLNCPLCCDESFSSPSSLKYHLLSIIDNLLCPACNMRFDTILQLAEHLGRECKEQDSPGKSIPAENVTTATSKKAANSKVENKPRGSTTPANLLYPKVEIEESENSGSSILAKALLGASEPTKIEPEETQLYTCQMCNIDFDSIEDHLEKYHEGQEVVLETEENDGDEPQEDPESLIVLQEPEDHDTEDETTEPKGHNTINEQQCYDKDGREYTRKMVKIDKFWMKNEKNKNQQPPITERFVLEEGKIKKVNDDEIAQTTPNETVFEIHQCPTCFLQFPELEHYYKHKCDPTNPSNKFKCKHCTMDFQSYKALNKHMKTHISLDEKDGKTTIILGPFLCDVCNTMFPSFKSLRLHKRMHDPIKTKEVEAPVNYSITGPQEPAKTVRHMFICTICNKTYDKEYEEIHMKSHTDGNNYDCEVCNRKFYTEQNLEMHMKAHNNSKKFACSYCKKRFVTYAALEDHVNTQCQKRQYECQYCGRRFARPHEKVKHERIHTGEKPHICQICGKAFRVSYCLTLHLRTHSGTRPYQCAHCQKRFKSHSVYNHHLLTHSDVRAYKCPYCPKAFKTSVQLAGHKNSHIKPFACTECNRPFASLYAVRAHMETHKRENNLKFDCWLCGASYARSFALKDHMKAQHEGATLEALEMESETSAAQIEQEMENEDAAQEIEYTETQLIMNNDEETVVEEEEHGHLENVIVEQEQAVITEIPVEMEVS